MHYRHWECVLSDERGSIPFLCLGILFRFAIFTDAIRDMSAPILPMSSINSIIFHLFCSVACSSLLSFLKSYLFYLMLITFVCTCLLSHLLHACALFSYSFICASTIHFVVSYLFCSNPIHLVPFYPSFPMHSVSIYSCLLCPFLPNLNYLCPSVSSISSTPCMCIV